MSTKRHRHRDPIEKHAECRDRWGECPHWLLQLPNEVIKARVIGISAFEFQHREGDAVEYLNKLSALEEAQANRSMLLRLLREQRAIVQAEAVDDVEELREMLQDEAERSRTSTRVIAAINQQVDRIDSG